jgi:hypothetical protein
LCAQRGARKGFSLMMTNFGFQPGILDYWMLLTDWRNGSFAILLALGILSLSATPSPSAIKRQQLRPSVRRKGSAGGLFPLPNSGRCEPWRPPWLRRELYAASGDD